MNKEIEHGTKIPSPYYLDTCLCGYEDFKLEKNYLIKAYLDAFNN